MAKLLFQEDFTDTEVVDFLMCHQTSSLIIAAIAIVYLICKKWGELEQSKMWKTLKEIDNLGIYGFYIFNSSHKYFNYGEGQKQPPVFI